MDKYANGPSWHNFCSQNLNWIVCFRLALLVLQVLGGRIESSFVFNCKRAWVGPPTRVSSKRDPRSVSSSWALLSKPSSPSKIGEGLLFSLSSKFIVLSFPTHWLLRVRLNRSRRSIVRLRRTRSNRNLRIRGRGSIMIVILLNSDSWILCISQFAIRNLMALYLLQQMTA